MILITTVIIYLVFSTVNQQTKYVFTLLKTGLKIDLYLRIQIIFLTSFPIILYTHGYTNLMNLCQAVLLLVFITLNMFTTY